MDLYIHFINEAIIQSPKKDVAKYIIYAEVCLDGIIF